MQQRGVGNCSDILNEALVNQGGLGNVSAHTGVKLFSIFSPSVFANINWYAVIFQQTVADPRGAH